MTTRQRRDKAIRGGSVISGLRLERDVAQRLCDEARQRSDGNAAELARYYIRTGLGASTNEANQLEETEYLLAGTLAGLSLDPPTTTALMQEVARRGMVKAALARHLIRRGLGYTERESMKREAGFAAVAEARHGLHGVFRGASEE